MTVPHTRGASPATNKVASARRDDRLTTPSLLTPKQTAQYLKLSVSWLAKRRVAGDGPPYIKLVGAVRYVEASLQQWVKNQQCSSTSGS